MGKFVDLSGFRSGRLTAIERSGTCEKGKHVRWRCLCDCGKETIVDSSRLINGKAKSCGCIRRENVIRMNKMEKKIHGVAPSRSRLYKVWQGIIDRCENENKDGFHNYGGRGITVCEEWRANFQAFRDWALANGYKDDLTLDRKDNDGPYSPDNCRWATRKEQANNRRTNILITFNGETHNVSEWSKITGISWTTLAYRIKQGWPLEKVFTPPRH